MQYVDDNSVSSPAHRGRGEAGAACIWTIFCYSTFTRTSSSDYNYSTDEVVLIPLVLVITIHTVYMCCAIYSISLGTS